MKAFDAEDAQLNLKNGQPRFYIMRYESHGPQCSTMKLPYQELLFSRQHLTLDAGCHEPLNARFHAFGVRCGGVLQAALEANRTTVHTDHPSQASDTMLG
jgi:hypothetical protein